MSFQIDEVGIAQYLHVRGMECYPRACNELVTPPEALEIVHESVVEQMGRTVTPVLVFGSLMSRITAPELTQNRVLGRRSVAELIHLAYPDTAYAEELRCKLWWDITLPVMKRPIKL